VAKVSTNFQFQNCHSRKSNKLAMNMNASSYIYGCKRQTMNIKQARMDPKPSNLRLFMDYCHKSFLKLLILESGHEQ